MYHNQLLLYIEIYKHMTKQLKPKIYWLHDLCLIDFLILHNDWLCLLIMILLIPYFRRSAYKFHILIGGVIILYPLKLMGNYTKYFTISPLNLVISNLSCYTIFIQNNIKFYIKHDFMFSLSYKDNNNHNDARELKTSLACIYS